MRLFEWISNSVHIKIGKYRLCVRPKNLNEFWFIFRNLFNATSAKISRNLRELEFPDPINHSVKWNAKKTFKIETIALWSKKKFSWHLWFVLWPFGLWSNSFPGIFRVETFTKNLASVQFSTAVVHTHSSSIASVCVMKWGGEDNQRPTTDFSFSTCSAVHLTLDTEL